MLLAVCLLLLGIAVILLEFFIPAFGLIGAIGAASVIGSIVLAFRISSTAGSIFLVSTLVAVPVLMMVFFRLFPRTIFGKKLILGKRFERDEGFASYTDEKYEGLNGAAGTAATDLRPSGIVVIDGKKFSAVSSGEYIEKDKPISVIKTEGSRIVVREEV